MALAVSSAATAQQKVYLSDDFDSGIPSGYTTLDRDENPIVSALYKNIGTSGSWAANEIERSGNRAAFSFSRSTFEFAQDNWLITPAITLDADADAYLTWTAKSVHSDFREDYKVMVSEAGTAVDDFHEVYSVKREGYSWTDHSVSLADYAGKTIYVAFVCTTSSGYILAVDDVFVGGLDGHSYDVRNTSSRFCGSVATAPVSGVIRNVGRKADIAAVNCIYGGGSLTMEPGQAELAAEGTLGYSFDMPVEPHSVNRYSISLDYTDGTKDTVYTDSIISSYYKRTLLLDEGTGNWCSQCPDMMPYLTKVKEKMGSDVIVVSAHMGYDPLICNEYANGIGYWLINWPSFIYNRDRDLKCTDSYHTDGYLEAAMLEPTTAMVNATAEIEGGKVKVAAQVQFAEDCDNSLDDYRVGFAIIDNEYSQGDIAQSNNCTTFGGGEYMYLPVAIPGELMRYHDMPIEGSTAANGISGCLPVDIKAGTTYDVSCELTIPEDRVYGDDSLSVLAFVIKHPLRTVLNATRCDFVVSTGVADAVADGSQVGVEASADGVVSVTLPAGKAGATVRVYSLDGRLVKSAATMSGAVSIDCGSLKGCYLVNVGVEGKTVVKKIVF